MTDAPSKGLIDLTANIVSAYLSNNPTQASEIPNLISQVHAALLREVADDPHPLEVLIGVEPDVGIGPDGLDEAFLFIDPQRARMDAHQLGRHADHIDRPAGVAAQLGAHGVSHD